MSLKFFADQCVPKSIIELLEKAGNDVLILKDYIPPVSKDNEVIAKAKEVNAVLLTLNGDFADIVTFPPEKYKGIVAVQLRNHPEIIPQLIDRLNNYIKENPEIAHYKGEISLFL